MTCLFIFTFLEHLKNKNKNRLFNSSANVYVTFQILLDLMHLFPLLNLASTIAPLSFPTNGDMLDYLVLSGEIDKRDGLLASWFHRANRKEEMNKALASKRSWTRNTMFLVGADKLNSVSH